MATVGFRAGSRASEVHFWLVQNPGWHAPQEVGASLHLTTHQAATTLNALMKRSLVERLDKQYRAVGSRT
jgi:predicted transcriptional regulator